MISFVVLYSMWGTRKGTYSLRIFWFHLVIAFAHLDSMWWTRKAATHSPAGDCFRTIIQHVMDNKRQLLNQNILIPLGDCFRSFIQHVRDKKRLLLIRNILILHIYTVHEGQEKAAATHLKYFDYTWWLLLPIYTASEGQFRIPWLHLMISFVLTTIDLSAW